MKKALPLLVPLVLFLVIVAAGAAVRWASTRPAPRGEPVSQEIAELHPSEPFVRVRGTAHYPVVIKQRVPGNLFVDDRTYYLYPLFAEGVVDDRAIRALIRTERAPERFVSYEVMTVEGRVLPLTEDKVPFDIEVQFGRRGDYFFADNAVLLEPWRIEVEGEGVWEAQ